MYLFYLDVLTCARTLSFFLKMTTLFLLLFILRFFLTHPNMHH